MKFSTQEEYGIRCLLRIARAGDGAGLTIPEISQAEGLSDANVAKLLRILRLGGFVEATRGRVGGYSLARRPADISISEVLHVLGGKLVEEDFCEAFSGGSGKLCVHAIDCTIFSLWETIQHAVDQALSRVTLHDMIPHTPEDLQPHHSSFLPTLPTIAAP